MDAKKIPTSLSAVICNTCRLASFHEDNATEDSKHIERAGHRCASSEMDMEKWSSRLRRSEIFDVNYQASPSQVRELSDLADSLGLLKDKKSVEALRRMTNDRVDRIKGQLDVSGLRASSSHLRQSQTASSSGRFSLQEMSGRWRSSNSESSFASSMNIGVSKTKLNERACSVLINTNAVLLKQGPVLLDESGCANDLFLREEEVQPRELIILTDAFMVCTIEAMGVDDSKVRC